MDDAVPARDLSARLWEVSLKMAGRNVERIDAASLEIGNIAITVIDESVDDERIVVQFQGVDHLISGGGDHAECSLKSTGWRKPTRFARLASSGRRREYCDPIATHACRPAVLRFRRRQSSERTTTPGDSPAIHAPALVILLRPEGSFSMLLRGAGAFALAPSHRAGACQAC